MSCKGMQAVSFRVDDRLLCLPLPCPEMHGTLVIGLLVGGTDHEECGLPPSVSNRDFHNEGTHRPFFAFAALLAGAHAFVVAFPFTTCLMFLHVVFAG
jgi:hypothetical protein